MSPCYGAWAPRLRRRSEVAMPRLLNIYDADNNFISRGADEARSADYTIGVKGGTRGFVRALDTLVAQGETFDRAVVSTHGNEGMIFFNGEAILGDDWKKLSSRGYEKLFPSFSKLYFTGCRIGEGEAGWNFLANVGILFLRNGGGFTMAHDSLGFAVGGPIPRALAILYTHNPLTGLVGDVLLWVGLKGKVIHNPWDDVKGYQIEPGGRAVNRVIFT